MDEADRLDMVVLQPVSSCFVVIPAVNYARASVKEPPMIADAQLFEVLALYETVDVPKQALPAASSNLRVRRTPRTK